MSHVVGIIPARGGSKGIPRKNMALLFGEPLIQYTLDSALDAKCIDSLIVSTDSEEIASYCSSKGCEVDSLRPPLLSTDSARTIDVIVYEIQRYEKEKNVHIDDIILLQPTAPLRTSNDIDESYKAFLDSGRPSLISCYDAESVHPSIMYNPSNGVLIPYTENQTLCRRQDFEKVYVRNGAIYIATRNLVIDSKELVSEKPAFYLMPKERSINIDTPDDLFMAEYRLSRG